MVEFASYKEEKLYYETVAPEAEFVEWYKRQDLPKYETPSLTIDNVMLAYNKETHSLQVLLIQRKANPFRNSWALPGGFVDKGEDTDGACIRETKEEVGLTITSEDFEQLHFFSNPKRDPRSWVVSCSHITYLHSKPEVVAGDDAKVAVWFNFFVNRFGKLSLYHEHLNIVLTLEDLAFDHADILTMAVDHLKGNLEMNPKILQVLGETFTIEDMRSVYAHFLGDKVKALSNNDFVSKYQKGFSKYVSN